MGSGLKKMLRGIVGALAIALVLHGTALMAGPVFAAPINRDALVLVNEENLIEASYVPEPLMALDGVVSVSRKGLSLRADAGAALVEMLEALDQAGYGDVIVRSAYRTYEYQKNYYDGQIRIALAKGDSQAEARERVEKRVALPGASEHQTGLAVDIGSTLDGIITRFHLTESGRWLGANAHKYGFILRYPEDKTRWTGFGYEPWHFRYVGRPHAEIMRRQGWILEAYLEILEVSHFIDYHMENGAWIRVALRAEPQSLPEGAAQVQTDHRGNWVGVYGLSGERSLSAKSLRAWLNPEKLEDPRPLEEEALLEIMAPVVLLKALQPRAEQAFAESESESEMPSVIFWRDGALTAAIMPNPPGSAFNGHSVHLPVAVMRVRGELRDPLQYVERSGAL